MSKGTITQQTRQELRNMSNSKNQKLGSHAQGKRSSIEYPYQQQSDGSTLPGSSKS